MVVRSLFGLTLDQLIFWSCVRRFVNQILWVPSLLILLFAFGFVFLKVENMKLRVAVNVKQ